MKPHPHFAGYMQFTNACDEGDSLQAAAVLNIYMKSHAVAHLSCGMVVDMAGPAPSGAPSEFEPLSTSASTFTPSGTKSRLIAAILLKADSCGAEGLPLGLLAMISIML